MKTKLSPRFWCAVTLFSLIGQVAWVVENMYFNVFIYNMFHATAADISLMVAASAVSATLTTVFMGVLSDRIGKRKLFMCGGYILWGVSIFSFVLLRTDVLGALVPMTVSAATLGITLTIILDCVMTFFGSTANDAAFNAWVTDSTDETNRGAVEGINAMMPLVAILVVFGGFMFFDLSIASSWTWIFAIIGVVVTVIGVLGLFLIQDPPITPTKTGYWANILYGFRPSTVKQNPLLYLILAAFSVFNISIQIFMPYLILYYEKSLGMTDYVFIMAPAIVLASVCTALWGKVYDKKGFRFAVLIAMAWLMFGYVVLSVFQATVPVFIGSLLMMCGYLAGMAVFGANIRDCTPKGKAGIFQGLRIVAQVLIPGVIGPAIGAAVLSGAEQVANNDGTYSFLPNQNIFIAALIAAVAVLPLLGIILANTRPKTRSLVTPFEQDVGEQPWAQYPRPQFKRDSYWCLNGRWALRIERGRKTVYDGDVLVPFPIESRLSGVQRTVSKRDRLIYTRTFNLPDNFLKDRLWLQFGAVDQTCEVFINEQKVGEHVGGYLPFSCDITAAMQDGENILRVEVRDPLDTELPYGKQRRKRGGMWYTPVSGIWQTVWLESTVADAMTGLTVTPNGDHVTITVDGGADEKVLKLEGREISFTGNTVTVSPERPEYWSPDNPKLYDFDIVAGQDRVSSYFALRTVTVNGGNILLNGQPTFFHGLLDQGYFSDGIYLPATPDGFKQDILQMKQLGFNTLRKHIKIEPALFYYYCDKYGMVVFQDLVNSGRYRFLIDTALPTIGLRRGITHRASAYRRQHFEQTAADTLDWLYHFPCICYYTLFNEGWGQYDTDRLFAACKAADPTRVWDATSGWFQTAHSDVLSEHIYFKPIKLTADGRPLILSEFGGYSLKLDDHSFNPHSTYGYRFFTDPEKFADALEHLYRDEVIPAIEQGLCGAVLTQVSDVEDETNGLLTYDRQVLKIDRDRMAAISTALYKTFDNRHP